MAEKKESKLLAIVAIIVFSQALLTVGAVWYLKKDLNDPATHTQPAIHIDTAFEEETKPSDPADSTETTSYKFEKNDADYFKEYTIFNSDELDGIALNPVNAEGRFIVLTMGFEHAQADKMLPEELGLKMGIIKNNMIDYLSAQDISYLEDIKNRKEIKDKVKELVNSLISRGKITRVLFTQYVIQ